MMTWNETIYNCPQITDDLPLVPELAGITHPDTTYRISRSAACESYVLEYIIRGRGHLAYGERYFSVGAGDVYFLQPHVAHHYYSDRADPWEKVWFNLHGPLMDALCEAYRLHGAVYFPDCPLKEEFFRGLEIVRHWHEGSLEELSLQIHRILSKLHARRTRRPETEKTAEGLRLKEYLDRNFQRKVTLEELARLIRKSPAQMMRIFRQDWGDSPYNYLQKQRSVFSCRYLENTDCPIKELAGRMGFQDEFYFSNWFKRRNGLSPAAYRLRFREGR